MKIVKIGAALKRAKTLNNEIRYVECFHSAQFTSGLIAFRASRNSNPKQITHPDKEVVCHVLKGSGRLWINGKQRQLRPGMLCHIAKNTPHDFAAGRKCGLVLLYCLIKA